MKRRWFQIHLSTAVVLMICAGGVLWLNFRGTIEPIVDLRQTMEDVDPEFSFLYTEWERGWPFTMNRGNEGDLGFLVLDAASLKYEEDLFLKPPQRPRSFEGAWYLKEIVWNVLVALGILLAVSALIEFVLRRYEVRTR